ncbi:MULTISPECIES: trehalose-6-phosphate synthase [unclassified Streptomyces]|uniref:alpha,alpha-trehalose-phosphate synthase (UDP-forming) n=1 Tax=unclassified Streptomyces TaxID=2593676 RepID=UPI0005F9749C|nr:MULTISPECIES: trehalose-6-phosphate synthase [unclassified Streptomyces]KJY36462.1 alpha,alpha-trehalose-phosphate synthase [Streptomyces sp. NRRL S-495]KOV29614.1 alpha,alpha-trehalose-phosphate synthase [Streptomyces sp. XY431]
MGDLTTERSNPTGAAPVLVASNRGPVSFGTADDGTLTLRRGGGGLVSGLSAIDDPDAVWVCAALSDADRRAAREAPDGRLDRAGHDVGGQAVRMLGIDPETFARAYNGIANSTLWFVHHLLWNTPTAPVFDAGFRTEWAAYTAYNTAFAEALAAEAAPGAAVLVQDYHLSLVPALLRAARPDLRIGHFSHTPWAPPEYLRLLPDDIAEAVLTGILGADRAGFLTRRWALAFADCCERYLDAEVDREALTVTYAGRTTALGVHGLGADADFLRERAHRPDVDERLATLRATVGDRRTVVRVDRTELSKNIVRGFLAYRHLLRTRPEWHDRVVHIAFAYPSRTDLAEYRAYTDQVRALAAEIEAEFGTPDWRPLVLHVDDDFPRSLAAYRLADVALVNPIRDGMNLVAKEVPVVSDQGCALVLSREAGAHAELGQDALSVNPYDIVATAEALHAGLTMPAEERADRCKRLAAAATALPPQQWFLDQLNALRPGG